MGPFCPNCWDLDKKLVRLNSTGEQGFFRCPIHKHPFYTAEYRDPGESFAIVFHGTLKNTKRSHPRLAGFAARVGEGRQAAVPRLPWEIGKQPPGFSLTLGGSLAKRLLTLRGQPVSSGSFGCVVSWRASRSAASACSVSPDLRSKMPRIVRLLASKGRKTRGDLGRQPAADLDHLADRR